MRRNLIDFLIFIKKTNLFFNDIYNDNVKNGIRVFGKKTMLVLLHDVLMIPFVWFLAYWLRLGASVIPFSYISFSLREVLPILIVIQILFYWFLGLYRGIWRFASLPDLIRLIKAVIFACFVTGGILFILNRMKDLPRSIFPIYAILLICFLGGSRLFYRCHKERCDLKNKNKKVLVIGAGSAGEILVRDLLRSANHDYNPIAFLDDAKEKYGKEIHGVRVVGTSSDIKKIAKQFGVDFVIIAIPSASSEDMQRIVDICRASKLKFKTLPYLSEMDASEVSVNSLRDVAIEDLLGRKEVKVDLAEIKELLLDKIILISGGGGSIGSEICRQVARFKPKILAVVDNSEFNLYQLKNEIEKSFPRLNFSAYLGSITDEHFVSKILNILKPNLIFHAAAYKHVHILEEHVYSAIKNNILGTEIFASLAKKHGIEKFILISTDKAVRPSNVMGATKRIAEIVCQSSNRDSSSTKFITVRFGNVLDSSGSVVPLFKKQLIAGGPITVTHPDVTRFFMTIPEASRLILQACALGNGGEIFVLDMGEPIKISYLAEQIIRLSGKEPNVDIGISYIGLRPGEKMHEELFYANEEITCTRHKKIFQTKIKSNNVFLENKIEALINLAKQSSYSDLNDFVKQIVTNGEGAF